MAEQAYSYALTTKDRVKDKLGITVSSFDTQLNRLINAATDRIEGLCGSRRFKSTTYTQEVYSGVARNMRHLMLKQAPVTALSALQYRAGTPSNPSWTDFIADQYELLEDGASAIVRIYGDAVYGTNSMRATYTAGYLIDWANFGDPTKHNLPADLSELADRMVIKAWRRRESIGKTTEGFQGATVTWATDLDAEDKAVIELYKRGPAFV